MSDKVSHHIKNNVQGYKYTGTFPWTKWTSGLLIRERFLISWALKGLHYLHLLQK